MCSILIKLEERCRAADLAYRGAVSLMKTKRGGDFERAWRLTEFRRTSLERAIQDLREHEREHSCTNQESFDALRYAVSGRA
jgi:hypothetical protein